MRWILMSVALLATVGCAREQVRFQHTSQIETRVKGVGFIDGGMSADVGMAGNTCRFDVGSGAISADNDIAQGEEDVVRDAFGSTSIVVGQGGVFIVEDGYYGSGGPVVPADGATTARITEDGIVTMADVDGACSVNWYNDGESAVTTAVPDGACAAEAGFTVDRVTATAFASTPDGVVAMTATGATSLAVTADQIEWDGVAGALYAGETGGNSIAALEADGAPRWTLDLEGAITSFDDMGDMGAVAVMTELANGKGELVLIDAVTGEIKDSLPTPSAAPEIVVGPTGETLAVILENEVHFFAVDLTIQ